MKQEVVTEARRMARNIVKRELKRAKIKISDVEASAVSKATDALLKHEPNIYDEAAKEIKWRARQKRKVDISKIPPRRRKR